jgi:hypothetical protein
MFQKKRKHLLAASYSNEPTAEATAAGRELRRLLVDRYARGSLSAEDLTLISWYHTESGGVGLETLAVSPDHPGNWSRHVKAVLESDFGLPVLYSCRMPVFDKIQCHRSVMDVPLKLPSTVVSEIVAADVTCDTGADPNEMFWGTSYSEHPEVRKAVQSGMSWTRIRPLGLYTDAVPYTNNDTFIGVWVHDLRSGIKEMCAIARA